MRLLLAFVALVLLAGSAIGQNGAVSVEAPAVVGPGSFLVVVRLPTGEPAAGSVVTFANATTIVSEGATSDEGTITFVMPEGASEWFWLNASLPGFGGGSTTVHRSPIRVDETPNPVLRNMVLPDRIVIGEQHNVSVTIMNVRDDAWVGEVVLVINGQDANLTGVSLAPRAVQRVELSFVPERAGTYTAAFRAGNSTIGPQTIVYADEHLRPPSRTVTTPAITPTATPASSTPSLTPSASPTPLPMWTCIAALIVAGQAVRRRRG